MKLANYLSGKWVEGGEQGTELLDADMFTRWAGAGGREELGGLRALALYPRRSVAQGSPELIQSIS